MYHEIDFIHHLPAPISMSRDLEWRRNTPPPLPPPPTQSDLALTWPPPRHVYSSSPASSAPLLAPPKPRRSRSPGEKSSSSSSRSRSRDRGVSHGLWESSSPRTTSGPPRPSSQRRSAGSGYPRVYHPDIGDSSKVPARHRRLHDVLDETVGVYAGRVQTDTETGLVVKTRASSRKKQEDSAPIAKRLRR